MLHWPLTEIKYLYGDILKLLKIKPKRKENKLNRIIKTITMTKGHH